MSEDSSKGLLLSVSMPTTPRWNMTLSFTPSGIRMVETCTRYIDVSAVVGAAGTGDIDPKGGVDDAQVDVKVEDDTEKEKRGWS